MTRPEERGERSEEAPARGRRSSLFAPPSSGPRLILLVTLLSAIAPARALANGGLVRVSSQAVGPYIVSVFSSPTPLRTSELDISVLVQDSSGAVVEDVGISVAARPAAGGVGAVFPASRAAAENKVFQAAKFELDRPGRWLFMVDVRGATGGGSVSFEAEVERPGLLDRPWVVGVLVAGALLLLGWLLARDGEDDVVVQSSSASASSAT